MSSNLSVDRVYLFFHCVVLEVEFKKSPKLKEFCVDHLLLQNAEGNFVNPVWVWALLVLHGIAC
jgi:hypothetical protein